MTAGELIVIAGAALAGFAVTTMLLSIVGHLATIARELARIRELLTRDTIAQVVDLEDRRR